MSETICKCGHDISEHDEDGGCMYVMNPDRERLERIKFCTCALCSSAVALAAMTAERDAAIALQNAAVAEVTRLYDIEKQRADFLHSTLGHRSLEYFTVQWKRLVEDHDRYKAALKEIVADAEFNLGAISYHEIARRALAGGDE